MLGHCRDDGRVHDSAGMTFEDVTGVYERHPDAAIVRLHSGDLSIYSAVQEQVDWCLAHDRASRSCPAWGSLAAASAAVARELTVPAVAQSVVATRLPGRTAASMPDRETVAAFARHGTTMAVYLSGARPEQLRDELLAGGEGYADDTPAAVVVRATWPDEQVVLTTVGDLPEAVRSDWLAHHGAGPGRPGPWRAPRPAACCTTRPTPTATGGARRRARRWGGHGDARGSATGTAAGVAAGGRGAGRVGAGPGDPDLLTLRAEALLAAATVVVTDRTVAHLARAFAPGARVTVTAAGGADRATVERDATVDGDTLAVLTGAVRWRERIVRLYRGDPWLHPAYAVESAILASSGVETVTVPGLAVELAVPTVAGIPVHHRPRR